MLAISRMKARKRRKKKKGQKIRKRILPLSVCVCGFNFRGGGTAYLLSLFNRAKIKKEKKKK
jgi:hypothetical protein